MKIVVKSQILNNNGLWYIVPRFTVYGNLMYLMTSYIPKHIGLHKYFPGYTYNFFVNFFILLATKFQAQINAIKIFKINFIDMVPRTRVWEEVDHE